MGNARTITAESLIDQINYELRNTDAIQFTDAEMLVLVNRALEMVHQVLVEANSELAATGSGTITLADGTETYALASNSMGDLWAPYHLGDHVYAIYLTDASSNVSAPLPMVDYNERFDYLQNGSESEPSGFYLHGDNIGFLPVPDAEYTCTISAYFPNFVPLAADSEDIPYRNLFNAQIIEAVKLFAKNRQNYPTGMEAALLQVFSDRAHAIERQRRKPRNQMSVRYR